MVFWLKSLLDLVQHEQLLVGPPSNSTEIEWSSISVLHTAYSECIYSIDELPLHQREG